MSTVDAGQNTGGDPAHRHHLLARRAADCRLCRLCDSRTNVVFAAGAVEAELMLVGAAPGYLEDRASDPFAGAGGQFIAELLAHVGVERSEVYATYAVKCRPPIDRSPHPLEVEQCEGYLFQQILAVRPKLVCALGNLPLRLLTGRMLRVRDVHGQVAEVTVHGHSMHLLPLYAPGAALYTPELQATLRADVRRIPGLLGRRQRAVPPSSERSSRHRDERDPTVSTDTASDAVGQLRFDIAVGP